jgi:3',5'-cyclic AMP phosphodiesterase CpdA
VSSGSGRCWPEGKEPECPVKGSTCLGIIRTMGAKACHPCSRPQKGAYSAAGPQSPDSVTVSGDACEIMKTTREQVRTLADLVRVCEIDTTVWEVERWVANKWEMGYKDKQSDPGTVPLYQIKAWLKRINGTTLTLMALRDGLVSDIKAVTRKVQPVRTARKFVESGWLFEFSPFDLHMGKYAWDEETVTNYDVDIAADLFNASLDFLLAQAMKVTGGRLERVLCVFGNDVAHIDSKRGETTAGTRMDVDTRYVRVYRRIVAVHRRAVDILRDVAPVHIAIVPGNHDELTAFHLGEILEAIYEGDKHVTVDNVAKLRKYYHFGTNLFGFTHGMAEKVSELPLLMAREQPDLWAQCASREWHIGHKHIAEKHESRGRLEQDMFSDKGVRIRRLMSLSAHDAWHTQHAYTDRRACDSFVFHKEAGYTANLSFNVDHFTGRAVSK